MRAELVLAEGLSKTFRGAGGEPVRAVDKLDLRVRAGEIYGLVGADGAGKTTTLRMLVGALRMDQGRVRVAGYDVPGQVEQARARIGYLSQRFSLYEDLSVLENIRFFAEVRGLKAAEWLPRCEEILRFVGLEQFKERRAGHLSGGMKQKLGLASALVTRPRVLLLDEPTTGVDPLTRQDFWQLIIRLAAAPGEEGVCVLISTPYMDEAARCHRVGFMSRGRLAAEGAPGELRAGLEGQVLELRCPDLSGAALAGLRTGLGADPAVRDVQAFGDRLHLHLREPAAGPLLERLATTLPAGCALRIVPPSLEDVFISLSAVSDH